MKSSVLILFTHLLLSSLYSQYHVDFFHIGQNTRHVKTNDLSTLSLQLTNKFDTDIEKVAAIFHWITSNIHYRVKSARNKVSYVSKSDIETDTGILNSLDIRVAEKVLQSRFAVCDGYARLFKTLCEYSGIKAVIITGYGRTEAGRISQRFHSNHTWNAVMLNDKWHLLDVTWASGFLTWSGNEFIQKFDPKYFLSDPQTFISDHYPDDPKWTLLENIPAIPEFRNSPFRQRGYILNRITTFSPRNGIIDANHGDTLRFSFFMDKHGAEDVEAYEGINENALFNSKFLRPGKIEDRRVYYEYVVEEAVPEWVCLLYNNEVILRYRLKKK